MRKDKFSEAKSEWFALDKRLDEVTKAQCALGYMELDKPRFAGYTKNLVLRSDIANRDDAHVFQEIINLFEQEVHSKRKDFMYYEWKTRKKVVLNATVSAISPDSYEKLAPALKRWFSKEAHKRWDYFKPVHGCNIPNFFFEQKVSKRYITKLRVIDESLIAEEAEIKYFMKKNPLFRKLDNYWYGDNYSAPHWYRRLMNRTEKNAAKRSLHKTLKFGDDFVTSDNYRGAGYSYW